MGGAANDQTSSASEPQEGAREQRLRGLGKFSSESPALFPLPLWLGFPLPKPPTGLIVCRTDGGLLMSGGKLLHRAQARVGPKEISQWAQYVEIR